MDGANDLTAVGGMPDPELLEAVEGGIVGVLTAVEIPDIDSDVYGPAFKAVHGYEPQQLGGLPAATLLFTYVDQADAQTGGITDNSWRWIVSIYLEAKNPERAQRQLKRILPAVLAGFRNDPTLGDLVDLATIADGGAPSFARKSGLLIKRLELTVQTEEG